MVAYTCAVAYMKNLKAKLRVSKAFITDAEAQLKQLKDLVKKPLKSSKRTKELMLTFIDVMEHDLDLAKINEDAT